MNQNGRYHLGWFPREHIEMDLDEECSWTIWKKLNTKFDLHKVTGSLDSLLSEIEDQWPHFLQHTYHNRQ